MKKTILSMAASLILLSAAAQNSFIKCGTMDYLNAQLQANPGLQEQIDAIEMQTQQWIQNHPNGIPEAVITIPVVVHVVYNTSAQNISDAKVQAQINQLNLDYARMNTDAGNTPSAFSGIAANTQIQFCLAQRDPSGNPTTGIIHKSTTVTSFSSNDNVKRNANGGDDAWPASSYLNIWSCNLGGGLLGYAQFPGGAASTDGVVLLYSSIGSMTSPGTANPYNLGRTATHEVGHWLNLYHIWGDDGTSCSGSDNVSDTPNQADENYGCPTYPAISCSNGPNGDMFMNYMDYTDDACMNMFSNGQATRMTAALNGTRSAILSSLGCTPPSGGGTCATPSGLASSSVTSSSATISWTAVSGATSYNIQYSNNGGSSWTTTTSTTNSKPLTGLSAATNYLYQVQAVCSSGNSTYSSSSSFTTLSSGGCSDTWEANNSISAAKTISTNTNITGLISPSGDNDYYRFTTTSPNTYIQLTLTNLPFDYDLRLYNSSGTLLTTSQNGGTTSETIKRNTSAAGTYYARVYGYNGANSSTQCYTLRASVQSSAWRYGAENGSEGDLAKATQQFFISPNPVKSDAQVSFMANEATVSQLKVTDLSGRLLIMQTVLLEKGLNNFTIDLGKISKGVYFMEMTNGEEKLNQKFVVEK